MKALKILSPAWAEQPEKLSQGKPTREACALCSLHERCHTPFMIPWVPKKWTGKFLGIGEAPGDHEDRVSERPFSGPAGKLLYELAAKCGYAEDDIALVNAVRCRPRRNGTPTMKQIRACRPFLMRVLLSLEPKIVVVFGTTALRALLNSGKPNVTRYRGRQIQIKGTKAIIHATFHPASVLHGSLQNRDRIQEDLRHAGQPRLPWPKHRALPRGSRVVAVDSEFTPKQDLSVGVSDGRVALTLKPSDRRSFRDRAQQIRRATRIIGHSAAVDIDTLIRLGVAKELWVRGIDVRDSLLIARMADENRGRGGYGVEDLLCSIYNVEPWKPRTESYSKTDPTKWPEHLMHERCRLDTWASYRVAEHFWKKAKGPLELTHRIAATIQRIYHTRAYIDVAAFNDFRDKNTAEVTKAGDLVRRVAQKYRIEDFEPHNPNHLRTLLYEKLDLPIVETTKGGLPSVGKITLRQLVDKHPVVKQVMSYSVVRKLQTTYVEGLSRRFERDTSGRMYLRVKINPLGARTGRRSSGANPLLENDRELRVNFQNFPKDVRKIIISRWKGGYIADDDYSKLEIILHGRISGEEKLVEYFTKSPNGYIEVGTKLFKKTVKEDTADYRTIKSIILGIDYNMTPYKLAWDLKLRADVVFSQDWKRHCEITEDLYHRYLDMFPKLRGYMEEQEYKVKRDGYVDGWLGQRRRLPIPSEPPRSEREAWSSWRKHVKHIVNEAINFPTQWAASLVTGTAMLDVEERLLSRYGLTYVQFHEALMRSDWPEFALLINEVHDDLVFDMHPKTWKKDADLIYDTMRELPTLRKLVPMMKDCPINVGQKIGKVWGSSDILKR